MTFKCNSAERDYQVPYIKQNILDTHATFETQIVWGKSEQAIEFVVATYLM